MQPLTAGLSDGDSSCCTLLLFLSQVIKQTDAKATICRRALVTVVMMYLVAKNVGKYGTAQRSKELNLPTSDSLRNG